MKPKWLYSIRGSLPLPAAIALGAIPVLVAVLLWHFLTAGPVEERTIGPNALPSPSEVFDIKTSIEPLLSPDNRNLVHHALISLKRVALGYLLAAVVVLPLGILMGSFGSVRSMFSPTTTASGYIPIAALVPLTMAWFGTDEKQKIFFLAIAFAIYLLPMVIRSIDSVSDVYLRTASTLGAGTWQKVWRILVPIALPDIWQGMRLAFGVGWTYLVLVETVVQNGGLGELIYLSQRRGHPEHIYLIILTITLIAWGADLLWACLGRLLFPYRSAAR